MGATTTDRPTADRGSDWPELISSAVYVRYEDRQYIAVLERFSIIGIGPSPAAAWKQMDEHAISYLELCESQGMSYAHALRPLPLRERLRHRAHLAGVSLFRNLLKPPRRGEQVSEFTHPHLNNGFAHAAC